MAMIEIRNLSKRYENGKLVLDNINLVINDREFIVIQGPSGVGKTSLIRLIAGLEPITSGEIYFDHQLVNDLLPSERGIAMVFQSDALFPNLSVYDNIAFGLADLYNKNEVKKHIDEIAELLEIKELIDRKPRQLSAGQQQRVALGRAMIRKASLYLMDEPLSSLDNKLKNEMCKLILKIHKKMEATTIYVTHDENEARYLADRIVVINDNKIDAIIDNRSSK